MVESCSQTPGVRTPDEVDARTDCMARIIKLEGHNETSLATYPPAPWQSAGKVHNFTQELCAFYRHFAEKLLKNGCLLPKSVGEKGEYHEKL